jgi:formate dehydrogenase major subunit
VWLPYHWGQGGLVSGDSTNDLFGISLDPNVLIQESKVGTCDVRPGRRPTGRALREYVEGYARRSGAVDEVRARIVTASPEAVARSAAAQEGEDQHSPQQEEDQ